jgi:hypothetical protein
MSKRKEVLAAVSGGPVPFRKLMHGRKAGFRLAYLQMVREGLVSESGMGTSHDPKYSGLPGVIFPAPVLTVRPADVKLLVRAGVPRTDAVNQLKVASGQGEAAVLTLCQTAHDRIMERGSGLTFRMPKAILTGRRSRLPWERKTKP